MKLHLPYRLYRALLAVLAAIPTWIYATPAATIPEGYTARNVSTIEDVTTYSGSDKQAFLLEQDLIFDASTTFTTSLFFTSADAGNLASLTFQNYNGKNVWKGEAGDSLTLQGLSVITIQNSQNSSYVPLHNNGGNVLIKENGSVLFSRNYSYGSAGAIRNVRGEFTLSGNGSVSFSGNYSSDSSSSSFSGAYGGAIYNNGTFTLSGTGSVVFNNNMSSASGGAIYNNTSGTFSINGNDSVSFIDNSSGIDSVGDLDIANNGTVIFRGNKRGGLTFSAQTTSSQLTLSARPGGSIEFDDQVSITKADAAKDFQVSYNRMFEDEQGGQHAQTGDIVFAGKNSGVSAMSNLYDGRLIMKDGAVYEGQGITVHSSVSGASTPTLRLGNGQLRHSGYGITVESGAALELASVNTVTASSLTMQEGSRLNVYVGTEHADASALTLTGNWELGGTLDVNLLTEEKAFAGGTYRLLTLANGQTPESWTADRITVNGLGATFDDLTWNGSTLYLTYTALTEVTWTNAAGDGLWSMAAVNWAQGDQSYAYQDGVKVVFGDAGAGEVILVGELAPSSVLVENSAGNDYSWAADAEKGSRLTGGMSLTKRGAGALSISSDHDYTGGTLVAGGTVEARSAAALGQGMVTLESATLQVAADGFSNTILSRGASCLEVTEGHVLELKATMLNEGTLTLSGAFDVSGLTLESADATHIDTTGQSGASGFVRGAGYSVRLATGTTVNAGAVVSHGDIRLTLGTDGTATAGGTIDYSTYYLSGTDTATTSAIHGDSATAVVDMNGGTLTVDDATTVNATGGAIELTDGALSGTLSGTTLSANSGNIKAAFTGTNTITGHGYALTSVLSNSGTLTLSGTFDASALALNNFDSALIGVDGTVGTSGFRRSDGASVAIATGTTVNDHATITHGDYTLTLGTNGIATAAGGTDYSTYYLTGSDAATTSVIHGVSGAAGAAVTMNGGTLTVDDAATVNATGGTIELTDGALSGSLSGTTLSASGGEVQAAFSGYNGLVGNHYALTSVLNNNGTLTLSGTFDASDLTLETTDATHIDTTGQSGASGFAQAAAYSVRLAEGKTADAGASITYDDIRLTLGTDGTATAGGAVDYSTYYLTGTGTATTSAIHGVSANATVSVNGGTLTVDDTATVNATGGALVLTSGALDGSLSGTSLTATSGNIDATFTGNNTIMGNHYALTSVLRNNGTLTLSGSFDVSGLIPGAAVTPSGFVGVDGNASTSGFAVSEKRTVTLASGATVDHGATITDGVFTYQLGTDGTATYGGGTDYSTYHLTGTDTVTTSVIHDVSGAANASVSMNGGTLTVDDVTSVDATGGAIELTDGALSGSLSGTDLTATSGNIDATFTGNHYALTSVLNNNGTLTLSGSFNVSDLTLETTEATHIDTTGQSGASGFAQAAAYSVRLAEGKTANAGASVTYDDIRLTLGTDGTATAGGAIDYSTYSVVWRGRMALTRGRKWGRV